MEKKVTHKGFELEYKTYGSGKEVLLAFHGMGRTADDYKIFENNLGKKYTIIAFNVYFHGKSFYPLGRRFKNQLKRAEFAEHIEKLLLELKIEKFSVLGYSLGGRLALVLTQMLPKRINKLILIAPDGLIRMAINDFMNGTVIGRQGLKFVIRNPKLFFKSIHVLNRFKIIPNKSKKIIKLHLETNDKRHLLRNTLSGLRNINPYNKKVIKNINENNIEVVMIFGKYDVIISIKLGMRFYDKVKTKKTFEVINASHNIIIPKYADILAKIIN